MRQLPLSRGLSALIDDDDFENVVDFKWSAKPCGANGEYVYAVTNIKDENGRWRQRSLHRLLMNPPAGCEVIFLDYDTLNCQKSNLRVVDKVEAGRHHRVRRDSWTKLKGISYDSSKGCYTAVVTVDQVLRNLGDFDTAEEATEAYDAAVKQNYGDTAPLHRPGPGRQSARRPWNTRPIPRPEIPRPRRKRTNPDEDDQPAGLNLVPASA